MLKRSRWFSLAVCVIESSLYQCPIHLGTYSIRQFELEFEWRLCRGLSDCLRKPGVSALSLGPAPVPRYAVGLKSIWDINILEFNSRCQPLQLVTEMSN